MKKILATAAVVILATVMTVCDDTVNAADSTNTMNSKTYQKDGGRPEPPQFNGKDGQNGERPEPPQFNGKTKNTETSE